MDSSILSIDIRLLVLFAFAGSANAQLLHLIGISLLARQIRLEIMKNAGLSRCEN
jgi:hypothetical protein